MASIKKKYNSYLSPYKDNKATNTARNTLLAASGNMPAYKDSYANQIKDIYGRIKTGNNFTYNPDNDAAYRSYADQYRALAGLAIAGNHAQAQDLTGGFGSTYAPEVAQQGLARFNPEAAQPAFLQMAENTYMANNDRLNDVYNAAAAMREDEFNNWQQKINNYNDRLNLAAQRYEDERNFAYQKYGDNRDYWTDRYNAEIQQKQNDKEYNLKLKELQLKSYDTYNNLAGNKCADFNEKKDNKGMKAYLAGLVKAGKITQYMADNLFKQYKYVPPAKSSGGGGGGRSSGRRYYSRSRSGDSGGDNVKTGTIKILGGPNEQVVGTYESTDGKDYTISAGIIRNLSMMGDRGATDNRQTNQSRVDAIKALDLSEEEKLALLKYYGIIGD